GPRRRCLHLDGGFVRLDLRDHIAAGDRVSDALEPSGDLALLHVVAQSRHLDRDACHPYLRGWERLQVGIIPTGVGRSAGRPSPGRRSGRWRSIVEFLVHIEVLWPPDADPEEKARLAAAEGARARELIAEGRIRRLWRIPGRWA